MALKEVLYEMIPVGRVIKVTAIDPETGVEISIVGDPRLSEYSLKQAAKRKLEYVLRKKEEES